MNAPLQPLKRERLLWVTLSGEGVFLVLALVLLQLIRVQPSFSLDPVGLLIGAVTGLAMASAALGLMGSRAAFLRSIQTESERVIAIFLNASTADIVFLAGMAGICEEALFRGFAQTWLTPTLGVAGSVIVVALVFGFAHAISWRYALFAAALGAILGAVYAATGSLLGVMLAHALYDFVVLQWSLKRLRAERPGDG